MKCAPGEQPADWALLDFSEAIEPVSDGGRRVATADYLLSGEIPVIDQGERFIGGYTNDPAKAYQGQLPVIVFGDHTRRVKFVDLPFAVGAQGVKLLRPCEVWEPKFLAYLLTSLPLADRGYSRHYQFLRKLQFPCPPRPRQKRIVAEIEKQFTRLDAGVAALKRVQANLKRYRAAVLKAACEGRLVPTEAALARRESRPYEPASVLLERIHAERAGAVKNTRASKQRGATVPTAPGDQPSLPGGWAWSTLGELAVLKGGVTKSQDRRPGDGIRMVPYLRVANVQRGFLDLGEVLEIAAAEEEIAELSLRPGDVLFNEGGDRDKLGRGWVWSGEIAECIHQNHVFRARLLARDVQPKFISWFGNSAGQTYFFTQGKQTTNLASINLRKLSALPVPVPPAAEQHRIVAEVERRLSLADDLDRIVSANLHRATHLRQSILTCAFKGGLDPQTGEVRFPSAEG